MSAENPKLTFESLGKLPVSEEMSKSNTQSQKATSVTSSVSLGSTVPQMTQTDWKNPAQLKNIMQLTKQNRANLLRVL